MSESTSDFGTFFWNTSHKMDMIFANWYGRSLCRSGPLKTAARKWTNYRSDLVQVQKVTWQDSDDSAQYFNEKGNKVIN